jgi:hypothetical protein
MQPSNTTQNGTLQHWVIVRAEPPGQYTAQAVGLLEIAATAATREEALERVRLLLADWLASGMLVPVEVPRGNPLLQWAGRTDPNDPNEQAYLHELARLRREDLEQTLREFDQECSDSSSTPTT